ncbi:hypothetical protein COLO4_08425 [Corchorus olitorius]|uniref:Uncharacterized protein n=1 Tax=Corchorus olitorius TaxID=93759 RepID=A0A1R3KFZ0_9ROSI|nr:hypothetical protein COLO4_08425 [Corchorus olitorius]
MCTCGKVAELACALAKFSFVSLLYYIRSLILFNLMLVPMSL